MGEPVHLIRNKPEFKPVIWKSSNYVLYGDMSRRMYEVLADRVPQVEPYSIDEMFLDYRGMPGDLVDLSADIRAQVRRIAKIPTCVGIGPTKTLAKLANKVAKAERNGSGVCDLSQIAQREATFPSIPLSEVWGMGRASVEKLGRANVQTVAEFVTMPRDTVREMLTVTGLRTRAELLGVSCYPFSLNPASRKTIACTRSFGRSVTQWREMREAIASYMTRAAEKLRRFGLKAGAFQLFMHTNRFNGDPSYSNQVTIGIEATADTLALVSAATHAASGLWRNGFRYAKAGIVLIDLYRPDELPAADMFPTRDPERSKLLMGALDAINGRFGRGAMRPAAMGSAPVSGWSMRRGNLSPCYTTREADLLKARTI
jgi:DNA polymerase V